MKSMKPNPMYVYSCQKDSKGILSRIHFYVIDPIHNNTFIKSDSDLKYTQLSQVVISYKNGQFDIIKNRYGSGWGNNETNREIIRQILGIEIDNYGKPLNTPEYTLFLLKYTSDKHPLQLVSDEIDLDI